MKKKVIALVMLMLAVVCIWLAIHATQNAILAWIGAVAFLLLAAKIGMGKGKQSSDNSVQSSRLDSTVNEVPKKNQSSGTKDSGSGEKQSIIQRSAANKKVDRKSKKVEYDNDNSEIVFITKNGGKYHQYDSCKYILELDSIAIRKGKAKKDGYRPCKECYPYGD